ncbi:MAG: DNA repair protein RecN [Deltaproteobacteria bacterium]|nr:DNA repair protein RecN [Deltaproteobacteria bacterium]
MLAELTIRNFAIIDALNVTFSGGLNILTGETGAGKSIIMGAVSLLLGDRASIDMIRSAEDTATVEALFHLQDGDGLRDKLAAWGMGGNEDLLVRRVISRSGKNRVYINGNLANLAMLAELGESLINICGQHEHQLLLKEENHIDILDAFGEHLGLRGDYEDLYGRFQSLKEKRRSLEDANRRREEREDFLRFQIREIEEGELLPEEDVILAEEKTVLMNVQKLMERATAAHDILYGRERSLLEELKSVIAAVGDIKKIDARLKIKETDLDDSYYRLEDAAYVLRDYAGELSFDGGRLEHIEDRMELIHKLKRKHGPTLAEVIKKKMDMEGELKSIVSIGEALEEIDVTTKDVYKDMEKKARELSVARHAAARRLKKDIEREIHALRMKAAVFEVVFKEEDKKEDSFTSKGIDRIEFHLSANPGEVPKPLQRVASGGELSRVILAMKHVLARTGSVGTMVFDEVDSGIGGATAEIVGKKIKDVAGRHQVLCITHLPQIACFGDRHYLVTKTVAEDRTLTMIQVLSEEERIEEITRMLSGLEMTDTTRRHAREMLMMAQRSESC